LFDYVESGASDLAAHDPDRYSRLEGYADDILEVCEGLDLRDVILVGHSVESLTGRSPRIEGVAEPPGATTDFRRLADFIWDIANLLRGDYKQADYGKVILPMTVLRRLDCVLESTKEAVLER